MQNIKNFLFFILGASSVIIIIILTSYTEPYKSINSKLFNYANNDSSHYYVSDTFSLPVQKVHAPNIPDVIDFAGEKLPIDNFDAKERFDRELISNCFRHSATFLFFKKANRYFPLIEPILKEYGIPDDVKYLAVAESALSNAVSPAGAKGFWQFMPAAARERGLEVNSEVDERYNLKKSTVAACKYLKDAYNIFGSFTKSEGLTVLPHP